MNNIQTNNISIPATTTTNINISNNNNNNNSNDLPHLQQCELEISNNTNTHEIHSNITNPPNTISPEQHITITNTTNHQQQHQQHQQHYPSNNIQSLNNVEILQGQTNPPKVNKSHSKPPACRAWLPCGLRCKACPTGVPSHSKEEYPCSRQW